MPIYEYLCEKCGQSVEAIQKISDAPLQKHQGTCQGKLTKQTSLTAFHLKGGGWYADGYSKAPKAEGKPAETKAASTPAPTPAKD